MAAPPRVRHFQRPGARGQSGEHPDGHGRRPSRPRGEASKPPPTRWPRPPRSAIGTPRSEAMSPAAESASRPDRPGPTSSAWPPARCSSTLRGFAETVQAMAEGSDLVAQAAGQLSYLAGALDVIPPEPSAGAPSPRPPTITRNGRCPHRRARGSGLVFYPIRGLRGLEK